MIRGYVEQPSPHAGDVAVLRVSTDAPRFRVEVYRCGAEMSLRHSSGWLDGVDAPPHLPFHDWGRPNTGLHGEPLRPCPAYELAVGDDWTPGVHVAYLVEGEGLGDDRTAPDRTPPDARGAGAPL